MEYSNYPGYQECTYGSHFDGLVGLIALLKQRPWRRDHVAELRSVRFNSTRTVFGLSEPGDTLAECAGHKCRDPL